MKTLTSSLMLLLLAACTVIPEEPQGGEETLLPPAGPREMVVEASEQASKTTIVPSGDMYNMLWDGTESVKLAERNNAAASLALYTSSSQEVTDAGAKAAFRFTGIAPVGGADVYNYDLVCPASAVTATEGKVLTLAIPASQTPKAASADPSAALIYGRSDVNYSVQPSYLSVGHHHLAAYGRMTLNSLTLADGETIESISITAEDSILSGELTYNTADGEISYLSSGSGTLTLAGDNLAPVGSQVEVWFACKPFTLTAGKRLEVVTTTNYATHSASLTAKADMVFNAGSVTAFPVRQDQYAVTGRVWYVSPSGNNSKNGRSPSTAWKDFYKVLENIGPGDQVRIMPGTFEYTYDFITLGPEKSGTEGNYISFVAHDPANKPVLYIHGAGVWNAVKCQASYIIFDGLEVRGDIANIDRDAAYACAENYYNTGSISWSTAAQYNANGISIEQKSGSDSHPVHVVVRNCVIHDLPGGGLGAGNADYITFENNEIYNCARYSMYANSGISVINSYNSDANTGHKIIIRGNTVSGCWTTVPWVRRGVSFNMSDGNGIIIDVNTGYNGRTLVENNVSFNNGGSGIHGYKASHIDIVGNTAYHNGHKYSGSYGEIWAHQGSDVYIYNNIMYGNWCNLGDGATYSGNIYYGGDVKFSGTGDLESDPLFVNASTDRTVADFHLSAGSPAIGHGVSASYLPARDHDGKVRGATFDSGAYQY